LTAILIETPTPSPQKQKLYKNQANSIIEEDEEEDNSSGSGNESSKDKDKLVKEGAYLKSRLWWFGLLLIATGEGGESIPERMRGDLKSRQFLIVWLCTCQCGSSTRDCRESFRSYNHLSLLTKGVDCQLSIRTSYLERAVSCKRAGRYGFSGTWSNYCRLFIKSEQSKGTCPHLEVWQILTNSSIQINYSTQSPRSHSSFTRSSPYYPLLD
jgi:hypothetical protein